MEKYSSLSKPLLYDSQLKKRLQLVKKRLESYPLDDINFVMIDLERPELRERHAGFWTYDLTGRLLMFYVLSDGIDGIHTNRLHELYSRIMQARNANGTFGKAENQLLTHIISGLVDYNVLTGDMRALEAAEKAAQYLLDPETKFFDQFDPNQGCFIYTWVTECFADLYRETHKEMYLDAVRLVAEKGMGKMYQAHSHGYLTTLRGIFKAAMLSGDEKLFEIVKTRRQEIIDSGCIHANGDICEGLPRSERNEACSIADWIMLNLLYGYYYNDDEAYAYAENSLWNALYFDQFVTGGFGHRNLAYRGYLTFMEEAWWCCSENSGMALSLVARHVVTVKDGQLKLNFLIPGEYTVPSENGEIKVTVTTLYPSSAYTKIKVEGTKDDIAIRIPDFIKGHTVNRYETNFGYELILDGRMGHYITPGEDGYVVKYGPLVLAPMLVNWGMTTAKLSKDASIPEGYIRETYRTDDCVISLGTPDADGFYTLSKEPLPLWPIFEMGSMAGLPGAEVCAAYVPMKFSSGAVKDLFFMPMCVTTSNLILNNVPYIFDIEE